MGKDLSSGFAATTHVQVIGQRHDRHLVTFGIRGAGRVVGLNQCSGREHTRWQIDERCALANLQCVSVWPPSKWLIPSVSLLDESALNLDLVVQVVRMASVLERAHVGAPNLPVVCSGVVLVPEVIRGVEGIQVPLIQQHAQEEAANGLDGERMRRGDREQFSCRASVRVEKKVPLGAEQVVVRAYHPHDSLDKVASVVL
mmetsp:Transcript_25714/g.55604  ORF Transcript_25714/g.55604 Transcript_25714/m.55604 type:complete len:200 (+) Transcript_25714:811-1410(+)